MARDDEDEPGWDERLTKVARQNHGEARVSKFDWQRQGPPRPGSSSMDHPRAIEWPYQHSVGAGKAQRRQELAEERQLRGAAIRRAEMRRLYIEHKMAVPDHLLDE